MMDSLDEANRKSISGLIIVLQKFEIATDIHVIIDSSECGKRFTKLQMEKLRSEKPYRTKIALIGLNVIVFVGMLCLAIKEKVEGIYSPQTPPTHSD